jgi:hypothetical protein
MRISKKGEAATGRPTNYAALIYGSTRRVCVVPGWIPAYVSVVLVQSPSFRVIRMLIVLMPTSYPKRSTILRVNAETPARIAQLVMLCSVASAAEGCLVVLNEATLKSLTTLSLTWYLKVI